MHNTEHMRAQHLFISYILPKDKDVCVCVRVCCYDFSYRKQADAGKVAVAYNGPSHVPCVDSSSAEEVTSQEEALIVAKQVFLLSLTADGQWTERRGEERRVLVKKTSKF